VDGGKKLGALNAVVSSCSFNVESGYPEIAVVKQSGFNDLL
jgi:hypothetical protein